MDQVKVATALNVISQELQKIDNPPLLLVRLVAEIDAYVNPYRQFVEKRD